MMQMEKTLNAPQPAGARVTGLLAMFLTALLAAACAEQGRANDDAADAAAEGPTPVIRAVFAPGQGENILDADAPLPASFSSQREMYAKYANAPDDLGEASLDQYFRTLMFDAPPADEVREDISPREGVRIVRDRAHNIPRVYGETRDAAMFGVGYARAQDRLWQMEMRRVRARSGVAALFGPGEDNENLKHDARVFARIDYSEAEYQAMWDRLGTEYGAPGRRAQADFENYIAGMNAYIEKTREDPSLLPVEFRERGLKPELWTVLDQINLVAYSNSISFSRFNIQDVKYGPARVYRQLAARFGETAAVGVYEDLRGYADPETPHYAPPTPLPSRGGAPTPANALPDLDSFIARPVLSFGDLAFNGEAAEAHSGTKSNALLFAGSKTANGLPMGTQGPQDGYATPHEIDMEVMIVAPDFEAQGILEFAGPYPYNGARGRNYAFSLTVEPTNQADIFAERLCSPDGGEVDLSATHYLYKGACRPFETRTESRVFAGGEGAYALTSERSVHGPVLGRVTVDGAPAALVEARGTFMREELTYPAYSQLFSPSVVTSGEAFVELLAGRIAQQVALFYVGPEDIAAVDPSVTPMRAPGVNNDFPVWGTGEWDWVDFDPDTRDYRALPPALYPAVINPESGVIAGWNAPSSLNWPVNPYAWGEGSAHRTRLLKEPAVELAARGDVTLEEMLRIHRQAAITDVPARLVYPALRRLVGASSNEELEAVLVRVDAWVEDGALRRDLDGDGNIDHGPAAALMDASWRHIYRDVFAPVLGPEIMADVLASRSAVDDMGTDENSWWMRRNWASYLYKDVRTVLAEPVEGPFSRIYCGEGDRAACRAIIEAALEKGFAAAKDRRGPDPAAWVYPLAGEDARIRISFPSTGAAEPLAPIGWQNRPTYHLVTRFEQ